jgi:GAF domain-containing protein
MTDDVSVDEYLKSDLRELTTAFAKAIDVEETLRRITAAAVDLVDGVDYADVMLVDGNEVRSIAPTAPLMTELDHVQIRHQRGPCWEAAVADSTVRSADLRHDERWPEFAAAAVGSGVRSSLSFQLYSHHRGFGALNLLSTRPHAFNLDAEITLAMLATQAAITLITADKETQFQSALASRDIIGQAKGILMERYKLDASQAFSTLVKLSQETNTPVRRIAQQLAERIGD